MPEEKESYAKVTWKEIVAGLVSALILGSVFFVFSSTNNRITALEVSAALEKEKVAEIKILMNSELRAAIKTLSDDLEDVNTDGSTFSNNIRSLERTVDRLEIVVGGLK